MRFPMILMAVAGTLLLVGCDSPALISMEPAVTEQEAVFDATLLGNWETKQDGDLCILRRANGNAYSVTYVSDGGARKFEGRLFQAGQARVMDLTPQDSDDFQIPGHALIRVLSSGATLRWAYLDSGWLRQHAAQELANRSRSDGKLLLTAPAVPLTAFLTNYAADERAHGDVEEWQRMQ
ncbi:MAG TPA: hypothetical protein VKB88_28360 [Bryobacteraceae bacterium]|nr:hypothetical protein [Bryobacteraceae bacterium]